MNTTARITAADIAPRLISEVDAARYLGRGRTSFRKQVRAGILPSPVERNGRSPLWDRRKLDEYVDGLSGGGKSANPWAESL